MVSERMRRRLDAFLDSAEAASDARDWAAVGEHARAALAIEADNADALTFLRMAAANLGTAATTSTSAPETPAALAPAAPTLPESFAAGRYHVRRFLGEGGKKRVFLAHDALLDRDVAFALIKTDGLDDVGRERITREAQAMGRLGAHPNLVTIFDIGEEGGAPFVVTELMGGGDVEAVLADGVPPLARTLEIAKGVARGLAFAHAQGIVHRDLKPGNVWLTADGIAKIGDFGLAVALNRSRLTLHGLMVGTVAYMPPEQALGGEVVPQSDLYSLGAMLYELVTGKPPFAGDSPTAVISQHINSTPVAPSWNSEHCPPELEALILRLLAKVPADRPSSALDVVAALEAVDPNAETAHHSGVEANPLDRLARGVFVGRERELDRLRGALDEALGGRGSVVMLVGEPGIGKTRTTQELETYARMKGAQVLWGRAHESAGAPPYWPWVYVARAYRDQNEEETRRKEWEPYAVDLQRIFAGLRTLFPHLPEPPAVESEETQFALFDAMNGFLHTVSARVPLMIVLDDLHWADRATLQMLSHLARDLGRARILILGTYRDTDLDRRHPLSQALGEMNREDLFRRIPLRGLTRDEVGAYIAQAAGIAPPPLLVQRVFEETEGNPFFLSQVVNLMTQEGTLTSTTNPDVAIPEGVREALGRRLDRLSEDANALLTMLAVVGRECDHDLARELSGHDDETLLALLEEAIRARVLEELGPNTYRFTHALMVETLLDEVTAARRVRLHARIAEALERRYGDAAEQLPQLASHYAEATVLGREYAMKAAHFSRLAAEQAAAAFGHDEAMVHFERCLALITEAADPMGEDEGDLWNALAQSCKYAAQFARGRQALDRALTCYAERGEPRAATRAFTAFMEGLGTAAFRREEARARQLLAALGDADTVEQCDLLAFLARIDLSASGDPLAERAEQMASRLGLTGDAYPVQIKLREGFSRAERGDFKGAAALFDSWTVPRGSMSSMIRTNQRSVMLAYAGDIDAAAEIRAEYIADSRQYRRRNFEAIGVSDLARTAWLRGERTRFAELMSLIAVDASAPASTIAAEIALQEGDVATAMRRLPAEDHEAFAVINPRVLAVRASILLAQGDASAAARQFEQACAWWNGGTLQERTPLLACAGDVIAALADDTLARDVAAYLDGLPELRTCGPVGNGSPDVLRGQLALRFNELDEAEQHFRTGLEWASRSDVHFVIHQGRCLQGLAEVAEGRGDIETARAHLDAAGELFAKYGAKLYLDQVLAKKQVLRA